MSAEGAGSKRRGEPRVPFEGVVRLRHRLFHEFLEEHAANISSGGMFIRTIAPGEPGNELDFEIQLDDDFTLIQGRGEVVWVRTEGAEPGMGIRFVELEGDSQALVDKIVRERVRAGLDLFDLETHAPLAEPEEKPPAAEHSPIWELDPGAAAVPAEAATGGGPPGKVPVDQTAEPENLAALDPEVPRQSAPRVASAVPPAPATAGRRSRPVRLVAVAVVSALVGASAVLAFYWLYVQPSIDALETRIDELAGSPGGPWRPPEVEPGQGGEAAGEAGGEREVRAATGVVGRSDEVVDALRGWAAAWSERRAEDYLAYYAGDFEPPDGLDRAAWEEARRARIARPQWIRVALTLVQVESTGPDTAEVGFVQSYRSERYKDLVRKRMSMVREDGGWKIAAERSVP